MLSSNTQHCTPLECGDWTHHDSIDIALRRSADARRNRVLLTSKISIALAIHSLDSYYKLEEWDPYGVRLGNDKKTV